MKNIEYEKPYDGAKKMLMVDDVDDKQYLVGLVKAMYTELQQSNSKKKNKFRFTVSLLFLLCCVSIIII